MKFYQKIPTTDDPIDEPELQQLQDQITHLAKEKPTLARTLASELSRVKEDNVRIDAFGDDGDNDESNDAKNKMASLTDLEKVAEAKLSRHKGQGKTMFFSYLSLRDKQQVLKLSGAAGAEDAGKLNTGKTAFFARLPGPVKYKALRDWQREREKG